VITPEMMKVLLDATSDNGGTGSGPSTMPTTPPPTQMPSLPLPDDQNPNYQRALKNNGQHGGYKSDDKGHTPN
jgi:hypothetical protein